MAMDRDNVIRKVQALLKLAGDTDFEGEMNTALQMAHKLLEKYDLSMSDVEIKHEVEDLTTVEAGEFTRTYQWIWSICSAINLLCNTKSFRSGFGWRFTMSFCGTKTDCAVATSLFQFLYATLQTMGKKARFPGIKERNSYLNGVGFRVHQRASEMTRGAQESKTEEEASRTTAIVHVKSQAVQKYMKETHHTKDVRTYTVSKDEFAFRMGVRDGDKVPLTVRNALPE